MTAHWLFARGALSFGIALAILPHFIQYRSRAVVAAYVLLFLAGMGLCFRTGLGVRAPVGIAIGSLVACGVIWYTFSRPWEPGPESLKILLVSNAIAWGCGGAVAGAAVRLKLLPMGAIVFGSGGLLAGYAWAFGIETGSAPAALWVMTIGWGFAGTISGGLFGAGIAVIGNDAGNRSANNEPSEG